MFPTITDAGLFIISLCCFAPGLLVIFCGFVAALSASGIPWDQFEDDEELH